MMAGLKQFVQLCDASAAACVFTFRWTPRRPVMAKTYSSR
jgi:hypothetical protein